MSSNWEAPERLQSTPLPQRSNWDSTPLRDDSSSTTRTKRGEWDRPTPQRDENMTAEPYSTHHLSLQAKRELGAKNSYNDEVEEAFDRQFYLQDEEGALDMEYDPFIGNQAKFKEMEEQLAKSRSRGDTKFKGMSARKSALNADQEAWEVSWSI